MLVLPKTLITGARAWGFKPKSMNTEIDSQKKSFAIINLQLWLRSRLVFFRNQKPYKNNKYTIQFVLMSSFQRYLIWWPVKSLSIETGASKCVYATCVNLRRLRRFCQLRTAFFSTITMGLQRSVVCLCVCVSVSLCLCQPWEDSLRFFWNFVCGFLLA